MHRPESIPSYEQKVTGFDNPVIERRQTDKYTAMSCPRLDRITLLEAAGIQAYRKMQERSEQSPGG
jgi:hypothetical protein